MARPIRLDQQDCLTLAQILRSFSAPITEEHAWAVIHQAVTTLGELEGLEDQLYLMTEADQLLVTKDGLVHPSTFTRGGDREAMGSRVRGVVELGTVVYSALDYSLPEDEERNLSAGLDNVIELMVEAESEGEEGEDEGIGEETGVYYSDKSDATICRVLELCRHHLAVPGEAVLHYRAVCRALVAEALELSTFMSGISDLDGELQRLDRGDWADVWTQVMGQLRQGIRLKKVDYSRTPAEYELTPYEMLMDDVRTRKYRLSPVSVPPKSVQARKDARDIILDFIRSRPPLKPAANRKLAERVEEVTVHDSLLSDIRGSAARQSLRKAPPRAPRPLPCVPPSPATARRIIELDASFADSILNFEESPNNSSEDVPSPRASPDREKEEQIPEKSSGKAFDFVKSVEKPYDIVKAAEKFYDYVKPAEKPPERRKSQTKLHQQPAAVLPKLQDEPRTKYSDWVGGLHRLDLTLEEVSHMRHTMTKVELEERELSPSEKAAYEKSKICFCCHQIKFNLLNWAYPCEFCRRSVCARCCAKIRLPSDKLRDIPVCCLSNQLEGNSQEPSLADCSSNHLVTASNNNLASAGLTRSWDRLSLRGRPPVGMGRGAPHSQPRLQRTRSMDKSDVEKFRAMQLSGERVVGSRHNVCIDCRNLLTSIVRAQRHAAKLEGMKKRLGSGLQAMQE